MTAGVKRSLRPQRVLMTADTMGGVWTYALELGRALRGAGIEVALATMGAPLHADQRVQLAAVPGLVVYESAFKLEWMPGCWEDVGASMNWLERLTRAFAPDVVHLNTYSHALAALRVPTLLVAHSCVCSWWKAVKGGVVPAEWRSYRRVVASAVAAADLVVAPTRSMLNAIVEHYGRPRATLVIPNARGGPAIPIPSKQTFVLAAGRVWDEAKNIALLDRIAPCLPWPVVVAGDATAPSGERFEASHLRLLGYLPPAMLTDWLARASIYACPAKYEPFGVAVLEAALAGCCLVLADIPSLRENWNGAAVFVDPGDDLGWTDVLRRLIRSPFERAEWARQAQRRARTFAPEAMVSDYLSAYAGAATLFAEAGVGAADQGPRVRTVRHP